MNFKTAFKTALKSLLSNTTRSLLTTVGVVIGVAAIIIIMSVGQGGENMILNQVRGLGSRNVIIEPGEEPSGPSSFSEILSDSLQERDLEAIRRPANVRGLDRAAPMVMQPKSVSYENETYRGNLIGADELFMDLFDVFPDRGAFFTENDIDSNARVAVLGTDVAEDLFGLSDPIGERITIQNQKFRVIGTFPRTGNVSIFNIDNVLVTPYTTAQQYVLGIDHFHAIVARAETEEDVPTMARDIELTLQETHDIGPEDENDFHLTTQESAAETVSTITGVLTAMLVSIAGISLVVGGFGIMSIMLVSVTERTREIGLRKALGATRRDIMLQFLIEAVILTLTGGLLGVLAGALFSYLISLALGSVVALGWTFVFPMTAAIVGLIASAGVGLIFGIYPARKAAEKTPIEALRYE